LDLIRFIYEHLGEDVKLQSEIQAEMTIRIPLKYSSKFSEFFELFDQSLEQLGVLNYGISISTLEEVFLTIGHLDDPVDKSIKNLN
jgi:ATP-binding cassette, subfamily A (ABC1), member 3